MIMMEVTVVKCQILIQVDMLIDRQMLSNIVWIRVKET